MTATAMTAAGCLALFVWTVLPMLRRSTTKIPVASRGAEKLIEKKATVYRSILDLDLDHKLGKVTDEDHRHMRRQLESEAIEILGKLDQLGLADSEELIEREIAEAREALRR